MDDKPPQMNSFEAAEAHFRGTLLLLAADIEAQLAKIISLYFCADQEKQALLMSEILMTKNFGFSSKTDLVRVILSRNHARENAEMKSLMSDLKKVREFRNIATHSSVLLGRSRSQSEGNVVLTNLKKGRVDQVAISAKEQEKWIELFRATHESLLRLTPLLQNVFAK